MFHGDSKKYLVENEVLTSSVKIEDRAFPLLSNIKEESYEQDIDYIKNEESDIWESNVCTDLVKDEYEPRPTPCEIEQQSENLADYLIDVKEEPEEITIFQADLKKELFETGGFVLDSVENCYTNNREADGKGTGYLSCRPTERLITAVYKRRAIWDPANELRKNSQILKSLWAEIAREIDVDVNFAKTKWKNLRAYFMSQRRELDKPRFGSCGDIKTKSSWSYYNQLLFLNDVLPASVDAREDSLTSTNSSEFSNRGDQTYDDFYEENALHSSVSEVDTERDTCLDAVSVSAVSVETEASTSQQRTFKKKQASNKDLTGKKIDYYHHRRASVNKRKLNAGTEDLVKNTDTEILDVERRKMMRVEKEINAEENPDLLFFKSLIPYMQEFSTGQKLRIRTKIQNLILAEHETMQQDYVPSSTSTSADSARYRETPRLLQRKENIYDV